jgi:hypothetical protein
MLCVLKRLLKIGEQVAPVFNAEGNSNQALSNARFVQIACAGT